MIKCKDKTCFNNDLNNPFMCDSCLNKFLDQMSIEEAYELYALTNAVLADGGLFETLVGRVEDGGVHQYRENLFDMFNKIMRGKLNSDKVT